MRRPWACNSASRAATVLPLPLVPATLITRALGLLRKSRRNTTSTRSSPRSISVGWIDSSQDSQLSREAPAPGAFGGWDFGLLGWNISVWLFRYLKFDGFVGTRAFLPGELRQYVGNSLTHLVTVQNHVYRSVLQQEFTALEAFGKFFTNRLFNNPRPRETNQRVGFGDIEVAQHRKTGRYTTENRIRHHRNIRYAFLLHALQHSCCFGHLHQ